MQKQLGIPDDAHWALVTLTSPAAPDELIAAASSYDASGRYGLWTRFSASLGRHFAGGEWRSDAARNTLATVTNGGSRATNALLTLHYDNGRQKYEMQQTIQPGGQMWVDFADLIHNRTPDRQGNLLPADLASATYDVQDLSPGPGSLAPATLAVNNTLGSQVSPDYPSCCGAVSPDWSPDAFDLLVGGIDDAVIDAANSCTGQILDISGDFTNWFSANPAVAQVTTRKVQAVSPGFTTGSAKGAVLEGGGAVCVLRVVQVNASVAVIGITSISPATGVIGATVPVTISGYGFGTSPTVTATGQITFANVQANPAGTAITANLAISGLASPGKFTVVVTNGAGQATTPFYITKSCNPTAFAPSPSPIACDGKTVRQAQLSVSGSDEVNVTNTIVSATSSNVLTVETEGSPYTYSAPACPPATICYDENYIGFANNQSKNANINWTVQIFCSNSPYPSETVNPSATITCQ